MAAWSTGERAELQLLECLTSCRVIICVRVPARSQPRDDRLSCYLEEAETFNRYLRVLEQNTRRSAPHSYELK